MQRKDHYAYDISTYGTERPDYVKIMVDNSNKGSWRDLFTHSDRLDPTTGNNSVGMNACTPSNMCVPAIYVPDITKQLIADVLDKYGKPTDEDYKVAEEVKKIADQLTNIPDGNLRTSDPFYVGDILFSKKVEPKKLDYVPHKAFDIGSLPDKDFAAIAKTSQALVTNKSVPCRPDTEFEIPDLKTNAYRDKRLQALLNKLDDLMDDDVDPDDWKNSVTNSDLTERVVDGHGTFDWIASAIFNQLAYVKNQGLITNDDVAQVYSQTLVQGLQVASQFVIQKDQAYLANLLQLAQIKSANVQALLAKAELLMLPAKLELAYAQLETERRKLDLLQYQVEAAKYQIPLSAAQVDQTRAQTDLICTQRKQALEQLAQAELDRKMKQVQIEQGVVSIKAAELNTKIQEHQADQAEIQTQSSLVQLEGLKEDVKTKNTQWQLGLKQLKAADVAILQAKAELKLKAQQLLKDKEQMYLIKAQTATAYAQVTATAESIKAAKAQYSDTIDGEPVGGVLGAQIAVNKMQAEAFDRDSLYKFANTLKDGWSTKKTADIATLSPNAFTAFGVDRVMARYAQSFNMPDNTFELPYNYTDYLTDEEMDGTAPTPSSSNSTV